MLLASSIGQIAHPFFVAFAWLIATFYELIPNYAVAIALLTVAVMIVVFPITRRGTRSMMKMQILAPEMKKLQAKYKVQPGMSVQERQETRQRLNEEMMALYKENNVSPTGGCLPMLLQFPIFWILYGTIRGLTHEVTSGVAGASVAHPKLLPLYINEGSRLYQDIVHAGGKLEAFGINLADSVRTPGLSWAAKTPFIALILVAIALQYIQMKQLSGRNPAAAQANPQMQQMQKVFPIIFAVIYISIPAGVNVYFIVSSLFRIAQQEYMYRRDPAIRESMEHLKTRAKTDTKVIEARAAKKDDGRPKGFRARLAQAAALQGAPQEDGEKVPAGAGRQRRPGGVPAPQAKQAKPTGPAKPKSQPRAQGKRPRRPR